MASLRGKVMLLGPVVAVLGICSTACGQVSTFCNAWRDIDPATSNPLTAQSVAQHVSWGTRMELNTRNLNCQVQWHGIVKVGSTANGALVEVPHDQLENRRTLRAI